ncbi:MAG TPA: hypothetical protein VF614_12815, partial [Chthoniobacteraceae bacterium]
SLAAWIVVSADGFAEEANGLRVLVQKTTLEREKDRDAFYQWDKVDKALALRVSAKNISFKEMEEGTVSYTVIVKRWGYTPIKYDRHSSSEPFPALKAGAEKDLKIGKVPIGGYEIGGNRKQFQDSIEGWQVVVKHGDKETIKLTSTASFDKLNERAKDAAK